MDVPIKFGCLSNEFANGQWIGHHAVATFNLNSLVTLCLYRERWCSR
jgi:hypothetical protein